MTKTLQNSGRDAPTREIRVAIVEDHARLRGVLEKLLKFSPDVCCCGGYSTGEELLDSMADAAPDIVSLDLSMPGMSGMEVLDRLRADWPEVRCIFFSGHTEASYVEESLARGGSGYVVKGDAEEFLKSVREVAAGRRYVSPRFEGVLKG